MRYSKWQLGFTLVELLISLTILGVIATFTIPKILNAQQGSKYNAIAKEATGTISGGYIAYQQASTVTSTTYPSALFPYMNYVKMDTAGVYSIDDEHGTGSYACSSSTPCLLLHNGAILMAWNHSFGSTTNLAAIQYYVDPDAKADLQGLSSASLNLAIYYNGRITTFGSRTAGTSDDRGNLDGNSFYPDPTWFSWSQ